MKTTKEIMESLAYEGESLAGWSRKNGYKPRTVYAVVYGHIKAKRGIGHCIAVKLGIKKGVIKDINSPLDSKKEEENGTIIIL